MIYMLTQNHRMAPIVEAPLQPLLRDNDYALECPNCHTVTPRSCACDGCKMGLKYATDKGGINDWYPEAPTRVIVYRLDPIVQLISVGDTVEHLAEYPGILTHDREQELLGDEWVLVEDVTEHPDDQKWIVAKREAG